MVLLPVSSFSLASSNFECRSVANKGCLRLVIVIVSAFKEISDQAPEKERKRTAEFSSSRLWPWTHSLVKLPSKEVSVNRPIGVLTLPLLRLIRTLISGVGSSADPAALIAFTETDLSLSY